MLDPYGIRRSRDENGNPTRVLPQQAFALDPSLPIGEDELLIEVESLNIDSASFRQIRESCGGDADQIRASILGLVARRGKHHNPVTGSGGMLIGRVTEVGRAFPVSEKPVATGDRVATLVSLTLTPLFLHGIRALHLDRERVDAEGHAILFASGIFARLPSDIPEKLALAVLDVAGAPAQTRRLMARFARDGGVAATGAAKAQAPNVVAIGGGGKSGLLCLFEAKKAGARTIAVEPGRQAAARARGFSFVDDALEVDARDALAVREAIAAATGGAMADLAINVANVTETEMGTILAARPGGICYFFSMATSFQRAALGAEGVGADVELLIGNGYVPSHAEVALGCLRESPELRAAFETAYGG